jgi:serine protease
MARARVGDKSRTGKHKEPQSQPLRIAIKFNNRGGKPPQQLDGWQRLLERAPEPLAALQLSPLFESQDPKRLSELVDRARRTDPDYEPADFSAWFQVESPSGVDADELAKALRKLDNVATAYVMRPGPPPVSPADDPRNTNQGYEDAAPNGIDARYAWGFQGGDGAGIGFVDMEQGWNLNHEDLAAAGITIVSGMNNDYFYHGTSVLGEVLMADNTLGGVGIAPSATCRVVSQQRTAASYNTADAIVDAVAHMVFGDVLLLEAQEYDPVGGAYLWPVEVADANYDAIRLATALGIVVVEAGCNGSYDLDAYTNASGLKIFDRTLRDSGAIMVGAGSSAAPHKRLVFSNHGDRIDCYAWGENVDTTTTDAAGTNNTMYTTGFNGTSGASPIITGAALIVQGIAQASLGYRFSPRELRRILTTNGTPSATPATDGIGVMPDLRAIITNNQINLAPDLYLRDYVGDDGNPTSGTVSVSPDIIVRQTAVANPQVTYGSGSGTENDPALSENVDTGHDNFVYVRVLNRGGSAATAVSVDIYWSPPATLVTPNLWTLIGTAILPAVPTGNVLAVSDAVTWPSAGIPAPGHYCFVAVAGNAADPKPTPGTFTAFSQYVSYVTNNNSIAWRNFDVIAGPPSAGPPPGFFELDFLVPGAFDTGHRFELEAVGRLPEGSRAFLDVPAWLADSLTPHPCEVTHDRKRGVVRIPLHPFGVQRLGSAVLHARSIAKCQLKIHVPEKQRSNDYEFAVRQLYKKIEVGRLTWRFASLQKGKRQKSH